MALKENINNKAENQSIKKDQAAKMLEAKKAKLRDSELVRKSGPVYFYNNHHN